MKAKSPSLSALRVLLQNQYVGIEQFEDDADAHIAGTEWSPPVAVHARTPRAHPYVFIGTDDEEAVGAHLGRTSAKRARIPTQAEPASRPGALRRGRLHTDSAISTSVRVLQRELWSSRADLWNGAPPSDPVDLLDPELALQVLGFSVEVVDGLGTMRSGSALMEVAGVLDVCSRRVRISAILPDYVRRFTLAHELGHAALHPGVPGLHRDVGLDGPSGQRGGMEREANRFAVEFLMPEKLVSNRFQRIFGTQLVALDESSWHELFGSTSGFDPTAPVESRTLATRLASIDRVGGRQVVPLANQFGVSIRAMAIRLEELGLFRR